MDSRCCTQHAIFPLSDQERNSCDAALHLSQHTKIELLPNVHINERMELSGFKFEAAGCDMANVLPIPTNLYNCIVAYEVLNEHSSNFNERVLHILLNLEEYKNKLSSLIDELKGNTTNVPGFHCMQDDNDDESLKEEELIFAKHSCDRQVWDDQPPERVGVYHAFVRPHTKDSIEHRIFIVLSGSLKFADEELFRLWQDTATYTSCEQLLESEEVQWLKSATIRNHNRVAARVADALGLPVRCFIDTEDPTNQRRSAHPCTISMKADIELDTRTRRVHLVDGGAFLHKSLNGILYELHGPEGYWIFCGPADNASYNAFGTIWDYFGDMTCFPTSTFKFSDKFPPRGTCVATQHGSDTKDTIYERKECIQVQTLFPCELFMRKTEKLGLNRNNGVVSLMPLVQYISEQSF
jgi:hypothetical protein